MFSAVSRPGPVRLRTMPVASANSPVPGKMFTARATASRRSAALPAGRTTSNDSCGMRAPNWSTGKSSNTMYATPRYAGVSPEPPPSMASISGSGA